MQEVIRFGKAISDPTNLRMLNLLREGELCICELEEALHMRPETAISRLRKLESVGIVRSRQRERWMAYRINPDYSDLVETIFEAFDADVSFDVNLLSDDRALRSALQTRIEGWCRESRTYSKSRSIRRLRLLNDQGKEPDLQIRRLALPDLVAIR